MKFWQSKFWVRHFGIGNPRRIAKRARYLMTHGKLNGFGNEFTHEKTGMHIIGSNVKFRNRVNIYVDDVLVFEFDTWQPNVMLVISLERYHFGEWVYVLDALYNQLREARAPIEAYERAQKRKEQARKQEEAKQDKRNRFRDYDEVMI